MGTKQLGQRSLESLYNHKYQFEVWGPLELHPDAVSTNRYDDVSRLLRGEKGNLLEVGCGAGQLLVALSKQFSSLVGIDLSHSRISTAQKALLSYPQYSSKVDFKVFNADQKFPFEKESFDVVVCCAVLEHVVDVFHVMDEMARVCRQRGILVLTVPNICYFKHVYNLLLGRVPLTGSPSRDIAYWREHGWDGAHLHYFSKSTLNNLLVHSGFAPEKWTGDGVLAKLRRWHSSLVGNITVRARRVET